MELLGKIFDVAGGIVTILSGISILMMLFKPVRLSLCRFFYRGQLTLLRHEITQLYYEAKKRGELREYEREDLIKLHDEYKRKGGNCYVDKLYEEMMRYPVASF